MTAPPTRLPKTAPTVHRRRPENGWGTYLGVVVILLWGLLPFYWMVITAFRLKSHTFDPTFWPSFLTIENFEAALGGESSVSASNMLKPMLARGELRLIGATTLDEYREFIEKDSALERRFQQVFVDEPSVEDTIAILRGLKERYEAHPRCSTRAGLKRCLTCWWRF